MTIALIICVCVFVLIFFTNKNNTKMKQEYLKKLEHLKHRIYDYDNYTVSILKYDFNKLKKEVDDTILKYQLIDSLDVLKHKIHNYEQLILDLQAIKDINLIKHNINKIHKKLELSDKYGNEIADKLINNEYFIDMTIEMLIDIKGIPTKIEKEVLKTKTKEIYIYGNKSSGDVFIFVNGKLERFQDR